MMVGRGPKRKGNRYFGPYSHAWAIRETVDLVLRVFPMRSCRPGVFKNHKQIGRPCLLGYIGKCSAPCVGRVDADEHRADRRGLRPVHVRPRGAVDQAARGRDEAGQRRAGVRAGGPAARRYRCSAAGDGQERRRAPGRHRRRRDRPGRGPARGGRADLPRPRRPDPRRAGLGGGPGGRRRHRRADRAVPAPAVRRRRPGRSGLRHGAPGDPGAGDPPETEALEHAAVGAARLECPDPRAAARATSAA